MNVRIYEIERFYLSLSLSFFIIVTIHLMILKNEDGEKEWRNAAATVKLV